MYNVGFANPPENFTCRTVDNENLLPKALLAWNPPDFNTTSITSYVVTNLEIGLNYSTTNNFYEIDLGGDQLYVDFSVYVEGIAIANIRKDSMREFCQIQSTLERRYGKLIVNEFSRC